MLRQLRIAIMMLLVFSALTGLIYPLAMTGLAQVIFHDRANGSLIEQGGKAVGSELIGQPFDDPKYFWGRPSATGPYPYNAASSTGSNLAVSNPALSDAIRDRVAKLRESGVPADQPIPVDLVTASGSGLDPHISVAAARIQVPRVARARGLKEETIERLVVENTEGRQLGILGEPRVNVLKLNLALDRSASEPQPAGSAR